MLHDLIQPADGAVLPADPVREGLREVGAVAHPGRTLPQADAGLVQENSAVDWMLYKGFMEDGPDRAVCLYETGGDPPDERLALDSKNSERTMALIGQGVNIPDTTYRLIVEMLTELLSDEQEAAARERWLFWLSERLDQAEAMHRERVLSSGLIVGA